MNADRAGVFDQHRGLMFSVAYGMLGEVSSAEDAVQDAYIRWQGLDEERLQAIQSPKDYLAAVVTRLCIDRLGSARSRREVYVGPWLPEPLLESDTSVEDEVVSRDALSVAVMVLLESLDPIERAVFVLREVFGYGYGEISGIVGKSEVNCRQISHRAKSAVTAHRPRFEPTKRERESLLESFVAAAEDGEMEALLALLREDVVVYSDGGGNVTAARNPVYGRDRAARFILGIMEKRRNRMPDGIPRDFTLRITRINGEPGLIACAGGEAIAVISVEAGGGGIRNIFIMMNPEKLAGVSVK